MALPLYRAPSTGTAQQDEIAALQAIFALDAFTNVSVHEDKHKQRLIALLNIELPNDVTLLVGSGSEHDGAGSSAPIDDGQEDCEDEADIVTLRKGWFVRVVLSMGLSPSYPDEEAPETSMEPAWLAHVLGAESAQAAIQDVWSQAAGMPVLFQWIQHVRDSIEALPANHLIAVDWSDDEIAMYVQQAKQCTREMRQHQTHSCPVCTDDGVSAGETVFLLNCDHSLCSSCLRSMVSALVAEGQVLSLRCPSLECNELLHPQDIKANTDQATFGRYEQLLLDRTLGTMREVTWCPRPKCASAAMTDWSSFYGRCTKCNFDFCLKCSGAWHPPSSDCDEDGSKQTENIKGKGKGKRTESSTSQRPGANFPTIKPAAPTHAPNTRAALLEARSDMINLARYAFELRTTGAGADDVMKRCPHCFVIIEKNGGCHNMYCTHCHSPFNWDLAPPISTSRKFRIVNNQIKELKVLPKSKPADTYAEVHCPQCRCHVPKVGQLNHLQCIACLTKFCFLCGIIVKKTSDHFSNLDGQCPQHSTDKLPRRSIAGYVVHLSPVAGGSQEDYLAFPIKSGHR